MVLDYFTQGAIRIALFDHLSNVIKELPLIFGNKFVCVVTFLKI